MWQNFNLNGCILNPTHHIVFGYIVRHFLVDGLNWVEKAMRDIFLPRWLCRKLVIWIDAAVISEQHRVFIKASISWSNNTPNTSLNRVCHFMSIKLYWRIISYLFNVGQIISYFLLMWIYYHFQVIYWAFVRNRSWIAYLLCSVSVETNLDAHIWVVGQVKVRVLGGPMASLHLMVHDFVTNTIFRWWNNSLSSPSHFIYSEKH